MTRSTSGQSGGEERVKSVAREPTNKATRARGMLEGVAVDDAGHKDANEEEAAAESGVARITEKVLPGRCS